MTAHATSPGRSSSGSAKRGCTRRWAALRHEGQRSRRTVPRFEADHDCEPPPNLGQQDLMVNATQEWVNVYSNFYRAPTKCVAKKLLSISLSPERTHFGRCQLRIRPLSSQRGKLQ